MRRQRRPSPLPASPRVRRARRRTEASSCGLAADQGRFGAAVAEGLVEVGGDAAQLGELGGERLVVGRARGAQQQAGGAAPLGRGEHARGRAGLDREPQAERRELLAVAGRVRAQLGRAEREPVLLERPQPGGDGRARAAAVAVREPQQRRRVPRAGAHLDRAGVPGRGGELELAPREPRAAELERGAPGDQPRVERLDAPAGRIERPDRPPRGGQRRLQARERRVMWG